MEPTVEAIRRGAGPYMNDDGDWWYPVDAWTWNEAQHDAALMARDDYYVSRYEGRERVPCHDHDDWDYGMECCKRDAYHFTSDDPLRA